MKILILFTAMMTNSASAETLRDVLDRHSEENHIERKKWDINKRECTATYPNWFDSTHPDYDKHFECTKRVRSERNAFEDKQHAELCAKFRVSCKN